MTLWLVRVAWATLPITAGAAAGDALADWSTPPRTLAEVLLWAAWAVSLVALLAPHPIGLTTVRVVGSTFVGLALVVVLSGSADGARGTVALVATLVAGALAIALPAVSYACANGIAYGDERRYPLRTPPALWLGPLPLAPLLVGAGVAAGPLLLADGRVGIGIAALVVGLPVAGLAARSLHSLSERWAVLVPAGLVVVDAMTLADPVLFLRERIEALRPMTRRAPVPDGALDVRLGARGGSVGLTLDRPTELLRARRVRDHAGVEHVTALSFATVYTSELLAAAAARRFRVNV
ncbi:MAG TPA: hypothetical protein VKE97_02135 [Acidimicrobiia bacterium]|nr:hypothetical protein [Acidimicrobiia bacterium]